MENTMTTNYLEKKHLEMKLDVSELNAEQIRLVRSISHMLTTVLSSDFESEYFESSNELMHMVAHAIKKSNFAEDLKSGDGISYAEQALEFCVDAISDKIHSSKIINFDN
jgi:hypothetical protein